MFGASYFIPSTVSADSVSQRREISSWIMAKRDYNFYEIRESSKSNSKLIAHVGYYTRNININEREFELIYRRFFPNNLSALIETLEIIVSENRRLVGSLNNDSMVYSFDSNNDGSDVILGLKKKDLDKRDYEQYMNILEKIFNSTQE